MPDFTPSCTTYTSRGERISRGLIGLIVASVAISLIPTAPIIALVFGLIAVSIVWLAFTGTCPADWFTSRSEKVVPIEIDYPDAREFVQLGPSNKKRN
jgi:hypothetical protein